jgi:arsenate reductase
LLPARMLLKKSRMDLTNNLFPRLAETVAQLVNEFNLIPAERKVTLRLLADFVLARKQEGRSAVLNFICTHNSRRSHISQLWAQAAAFAYGVPDIICLSGGTEATAFNPRAVLAMQQVGFQIHVTSESPNPRYDVRFAENAPAVIAFSKTFDDPFNRASDFAAVMTCSHADENCPFIPGATQRIALTYEDPKAFDDTPEESQGYAERVRQIGRELLYGFSLIAREPATS